MLIIDVKNKLAKLAREATNPKVKEVLWEAYFKVGKLHDELFSDFAETRSEKESKQ